MKAVIMAGGEGTRLRPVNETRPKPMVNLFDRPILEHILLLLRENGITEVCMTVRHMASAITERFGCGDFFGMSIEYRHETSALGTAGGVKNCADFIGNDDFLVISGDCVCDLALRLLISFRREKNCDAALALTSCRDPLEYGSVVMEPDGRILRFSEKPAWDSVVSDLVNTGIYCLSPSVLELIPEGAPCDFGKDLFPLLLQRGKGIYGLALPGYWCDIGSPAAFRQCCMDALEGKINLIHGLPESVSGIMSLSKIPGSAVIVPPVYIGRNVTVASGAQLGPCAVIGADCIISSGSVVTGSVLDGVSVGKDAHIEGAVICRETALGEGVQIRNGAVIGERARIGAQSAILENVAISAGADIPPHKRIEKSFTGAFRGDKLRFQSASVLSGAVETVLTPEVCARLGALTSPWVRVGIAFGGGDCARALSEAFASGVCSGGAQAVMLDSAFPAATAFAGTKYMLPVAAHFERTDDKASIRFFTPGGHPLPRDIERRLEAGGDIPRAGIGHFGKQSRMCGLFDAYCAAAVQNAPSRADGYRLSVSGSGAENAALRNALSRLGCAVTDRLDVPVFTAEAGGFALTATENGHRFRAETLFLAAALCELERGTRLLSVPFAAPSAVETLARQFGASVLRLGRDGERAKLVYSSLPAMRDGVFAACLIVSHLAAHRETLTSLTARLPDFSAVTESVPVACGRASALRKLAAGFCAEFAAELGQGVRMDTGDGWVTVRASHEHDTLLLRAEGTSEDSARKLCSTFADRIRRAASGNS